MSDKLLFKAAVTVSTIGILCLFVFSSSIEPDAERLSALDKMMGEKVKIIGVLESHQQYGNVNVLTISEQTQGEVIVFNNLSKIQKGTRIEVIGTVQKEGDKEQIIADRLRII